jgi:hypothetical protein
MVDTTEPWQLKSGGVCRYPQSNDFIYLLCVPCGLVIDVGLGIPCFWSVCD